VKYFRYRVERGVGIRIRKGNRIRRKEEKVGRVSLAGSKG
jgi:hypothetical protein